MYITLHFPQNVKIASRLYYLYYLHFFGLDPVTTAYYPAHFYLNIVNIFHQNMVHVASIHTDLDFL